MLAPFVGSLSLRLGESVGFVCWSVSVVGCWSHRDRGGWPDMGVYLTLFCYRGVKFAPLRFVKKYTSPINQTQHERR